MRTYLLPSIAALVLALPMTADAGLVVGWETWSSGSENATITNGDATGVATETGGDWREQSEAASTDGTFGTLAGAAVNTSGTHIGVTTGSGSYDFTVTAGTNGLVLETFHFDAQRKRNGSPENWVVLTQDGAITTGIQLGNGTLSTLGTGGPSDHADFDLDLTGLADNTLDPGESATFRISFSGGNPFNTDQKTFLDNVAISGTSVPVPEPVSMTLLGLGGLLALRRRR